MKIGFYAYDVGPTAALKPIAETAQKEKHEIVFPSSGEPVSLKDMEALMSCDVVLLGGPSSFHTKDGECVVALMLDREGIPYIILEDVPGSSLRPAGRGMAKYAHSVLTAMPEWKNRAFDFGYKQAVYLGPPPHWGPMFEAMTSAPDIRRQLLLRDQNGSVVHLSDDDVVFFYAGIKDPKHNNDILRFICDVGKSVVGEKQFVLGFKPHPREDQDATALIERRTLLDSVPHLDGERSKNFSVQELVKAVDIPVFSGGSTDSIIAAFAQMKSLYVSSKAVRERNIRQGVPGDGEWFVAELGGCVVIDMDESPVEARNKVRFLLTAKGAETLRITQRGYFKVPRDWNTSKEILSYLSEIQSGNL